jgi:hypothetical protein
VECVFLSSGTVFQAPQPLRASTDLLRGRIKLLTRTALVPLPTWQFVRAFLVGPDNRSHAAHEIDVSPVHNHRRNFAAKGRPG